MAISGDDLDELRSIVGHDEPPTDGWLEMAFDRLGSIWAVALEVQRGRLAKLRSHPSSLTIDGDRTENWTGTIQSLERQVAELEAKAAVAADPSAGQVVIGHFQRASRSR